MNMWEMAGQLWVVLPSEMSGLVERCVVSLIDSVFFDETDEADGRYTYC